MSRSSKPRSEARILELCVSQLGEVLPAGWSARVDPSGPNVRPKDSALILRSPDQREAHFGLVVTRTSTPKSTVMAVDQRRSSITDRPTSGRQLFVSSYLASRTRDLLEQRDVGWMDVTGNVRITAPSPGLFLNTVGAQRDPWPADQPLKTLGGHGASRAVRALIDFAPPYGIRQLSESAHVPAPTLSRVVELLVREAFVERSSKGGVAGSDWPNVVRRWAQDLILRESASNRVFRYIEPRGIDKVLEGLSNTECRYAITGSFAASQNAPIAPTRQLVIYTDNVAVLEEVLKLRPTESNSNVLLVEPYDPVVFERTTRSKSLVLAAASQVAADLLRGPGREPSEGEAMIEWMMENEGAWRRGP